jgi:hypothetical protein
LTDLSNRVEYHEVPIEDGTIQMSKESIPLLFEIEHHTIENSAKKAYRLFAQKDQSVII